MLPHSRMMELGSPAPDFDLPDMADPGGGRRSLASFAGSPALLVAFICNHCPFVLHILDGLVTFAADYRPKGLRTVAISANDVDTHPNDAPDRMTEMARGRGFQFPYLYDASQRTALDYGAICTPDFFLFDGGRRLFYRGQFDGSRPHTEWDADKPRNIVPVTGADLRAAADALLAGAAPPANQRPSAGCSIKWKPDNEPEWA